MNPPASPISDGCGNSVPTARARPRPSERNLQIYEAVRLHGETQAAVAAVLGLSQRRVSTICRQVEIWRPSSRRPTAPRPPIRPGSSGNCSAGNWSGCFTWRRARCTALRLPLVVERRGGQATEAWCETTTRDQVPCAKWIRVAARASELLVQLESLPLPQYLDEAQRLAQIAATAQQFLRQSGDLHASQADRTNGDRSRSSRSKADPGSSALDNPQPLAAKEVGAILADQ